MRLFFALAFGTETYIECTSTLHHGQGVRAVWKKLTDCSADFDNGWLVGNSLSLFDGLLNAFEVMITIIDCLSVPSVSLKAFENVFGKGESSVTIDGNVVVVVQRNELSELQVSLRAVSFFARKLSAHMQGTIRLTQPVSMPQTAHLLEDIHRRESHMYSC